PHDQRIFARIGWASDWRLNPWTIFFLFPDRDSNCVRCRRKSTAYVSNTRSVIPSGVEGSRRESLSVTDRDPSSVARDDGKVGGSVDRPQRPFRFSKNALLISSTCR